MSKKKVDLLSLNGCRFGHKTESNDIFNAKTPFLNSCLNKHCYSTLHTSDKYIGLPCVEMENLEVRHLNIGQEIVVYQYFLKINKVYKNNSIAKNKTLLAVFKHLKTNNVAVNFMGLVYNWGMLFAQKNLYKLWIVQ